jgi:ABC-2 type transport system permease protein
MEAVAAMKPVKINRWLPYWAVFQADIRQTMQSWVYRTWVLLSVLAAVGYLLYRVGLYREAGIIQTDVKYIAHLLRWTVIGSVTMIVAITVGSISSERGTMADSVLSRGISRYQYFMGKWHARLATVLGSFFVMGMMLLVASYFLLEKQIKFNGAIVALVTVAGLLTTVITLGVTVSAITNSTVMGVAVLWMTLYGVTFLMSMMPEKLPSLDGLLDRMPHVLKGDYDLATLGRIMAGSMVLSLVSAGIGMAYFARRDI